MPKYLLEILVPLEGETDEEIVELAQSYVKYGLRADCSITISRQMEEISDDTPEPKSLTFDELMDSLDTDDTEKH